jgi:hypothetical protein
MSSNRHIPINKLTILAALAAIGATTASITYSGGGDDGTADSVDVQPIEAWKKMPPNGVLYASELRAGKPGTPQTQMQELGLEAAIDRFVDDLLDDVHPGWALNGGSNGEIIFEVGSGTVRIEHHDSANDYDEREI